MKLPTKLPTWMGILLVIALVTSIIIFTENAFRSPSEASDSEKPNNIRVTNVSDTLFTISWTTSKPSTGTLNVVSGTKNSTLFDERDTSGKLGKYLVHSFTVRNTKASTEYVYKPVSNGRIYVENGKSYSVRTASPLFLNDGTLEPAYGTIKTASETPADDAIVYFTMDGGQDLSTVTKPTGTWLIPLSQIRTADLTAYLPTVERMNEHITVISGGETISAETDTLNDSPVPDMNLGKQYDFRRQQAKTAGNALTLRPAIPNLPVNTAPAVLGEQTTQIYTVTITSPKDNSSIPSTLPLIQGTGVPGKYIGISVGFINPIHGSVKVAQNGIWSFTPSNQLNPGNQSVTISSVDSKGKPIAITQKFSILKSGTQVLGDATPSATLTPNTTITVTPTILELVSPTETPISSLSGSKPPTTGNEFPTLLLLILGLGMITGGSVALLNFLPQPTNSSARVRIFHHTNNQELG